AFTTYQELVERLADDPEAWQRPGLLARTPLVESADDAEQVAALTTGEVSPGEGLLHEGVERAAARWPERAAVVWSSGELTYGELVARSRRIGWRLRDLDVRPGELVAVCMDKGWEQVAAVHGTLASGAAYVPIDPGLPAARRARLLERTGVRVVLTQQAVADRLEWPDQVTVLPVDDCAGWTAASEGPLPVVQEPDDLAYVIFTSGSTGEPKGVMIDHRGAVNTVTDVNERFGLGPDDRVLAVSSLSFDLSVWDVFGTLAAGAALVMPDPGTEREPGHWVELIDRHGVTVWNSVPALFELAVEQAAHEGGGALGSLRLAMLSGDWIPLSLPDRARDVVAGLQVISLGGATEASIWSIFYPIEAVQEEWASIPYGRALRGQSVQVLDAELRPRPAWAVGELYIGGTGVALGYWADEEKTAAAFITHPETGERLYRTGDLGRYWPDGTIEFLGREDTQVKIGGFRIELGEIETTLAAHPELAAAIVTAHGDPRGTRRLIGYVLPADGHTPDQAALREWLGTQLPAYMVPGTIITLDALPLTANGKVDRSALPDPQHAAGNEALPHTPPRNPTEHTLTRIWSELLNTPTLSVHDNLFDQGADSLLALRATSSADDTGLHLELRDIFQNPTIAEQATLVKSVATDVEQGQVSGPTGMTPSQFWFLSHDLPGRHHWNDASFLLSLQHPLDPDVIEAALRRVLEHHDGLRLRFRETDGWQARIEAMEPDEPLPFSVHDLSNLETQTQKKAIIEISDRLQESLSLDQGPMLRLAYFDLGDRPHCLLFLAHWLVVDHYSARVTLEDLLFAYERLHEGEEARLPAKTTTFPEWTRLLSEHARTDAVLDQLDYWTRPERAKASPVRRDHPTGSNDLAFLQTTTARLDLDLTEALLREVTVAYGVEMTDVLCAALLRAVPLDAADEDGPRRVLVDFERHGRDLPIPGARVSRTVGRLSTIAPILVEFEPAEPVTETVHDVARQFREVPGQFAGYGLLRHLSDDPRAAALATMPGAEVGLNYIGQIDELFLRSDLLSVPRLSYGRQRSRAGRRFRVIDLISYIVAGRLTLDFGYSSGLHDSATIDALVASMTNELRSLAEQARERE
ncbi:amino acid adenylation domain-containing protein, partial [Actinomadura sp. KC216]|uniref:non-ribosomal peptide synthetase n=1 Tax=Actinomadura sp. KC216 TaxID=2530370 RepID=UPI00104F8BC9